MPVPEVPPLWVLCHPLLDVVVDVDDTFLQTYQLEKGCAYIYGPQFRTLFETILQHRTLGVAPGGAGLNTARVAQWVWQHVLQLPGHVMYVGCVGKDQYGDQIRSAAEADGVVMKLEVSEEKRSGLCAVCKVGDSRTLVANPSAACCLSDAFVSSPAVMEGQSVARIVYTTAYANVFRTKQMLQLMASSRTRTLPDGRKQYTSMGLSNKRVLNEFGDDLVDVLNMVDIIIGDEEEMNDLAMMLQWIPSEWTATELVRKLATEMMYDHHVVRHVIMTRGAQPIVYATGDGETGEVPVAACDRKTTTTVATGAGDAFAGAFLSTFAARPDDLAYCCRIGAHAAAFVINHSIKSMPTDPATIDAFPA